MMCSVVQARWFTFLALILMALGGVSCERISQRAEDRDPSVKRARDRRAVGDYAGAIEAYEKALDKRPRAGRIHWEMASIYDQHLTNDLRAIYHYERFLELEPKSERRPFAEKLIAAAKLSYAVSLPDKFSDAVEENARLQKEIKTLQQLLTETRDELARVNQRPPAAASPAAAASVPVAAARPVSPRTATEAATTPPAAAKPVTFDTYVVQPGDTLSHIAGKVYGDAKKWNPIFDANRDQLPKPEAVKVGQTLKIPR